ncbi:putative PAN domain protein [Trichinella spiralis]|uniref:putative PAN domain protein n=2 Tax=Trichinella spiralis TaxID=6334 RepID=UPI0001EFC627|nr:putative PAN domain protein [Trichinella spiralis]
MREKRDRVVPNPANRQLNDKIKKSKNGIVLMIFLTCDKKRTMLFFISVVLWNVLFVVHKGESFNNSHLTIYVPRLDKVCHIEERDELKVFTNNAPYVTTFSNCIAECWLWENRDTFCIGILYDFSNNYCFLYNRLFKGGGDNSSNTHFYMLHTCLDDLIFPTILIAFHLANLVENFAEDGIIENVTRLNMVSLPALNEICIIERLPFINNFAANRLHKVLMLNILTCFAHCRVLNWTIPCNAVLFSREEGICLFLDYNDTDQESGTIRRNYAEFYSIKHCEFSKKFTIQ